MANAPESFYEYSVVVGDDPPKAQGGGGGESAYNSNIVTLEGGTSSANGVVPYIEVIYTSPSTTGGESITTKIRVSTNTHSIVYVEVRACLVKLYAHVMCVDSYGFALISCMCTGM